MGGLEDTGMVTGILGPPAFLAWFCTLIGAKPAKDRP
jgi:hypothetical protein